VNLPPELVAAAIAAIFGALIWSMKADRADAAEDRKLLREMATKSLAEVAGGQKEMASAIHELAAEMRDLTGQVREVREDVAELTPPPVDTREDITSPLGRVIPGGREAGRYSQTRKPSRGGGG
jgi:hypothetical protein